MIKKLTVFILLLFISIPMLANELDSLKLKLSKAKNDSAKIELLYRFSIRKKNSLKVTDSILDVIRDYSRSKDCFTKLFCFYRIGSHYSVKESLHKSVENLMIALRMADSCANKRMMMLTYGRLAYINKISENFQAAILNAHYSLGYRNMFKDSALLADNYTLLGNMYKTKYLLDSALLYHNKVLAIREKLGNDNLLAQTYNNLGLVYKNKKDYLKALFYLRKCMVLKIKIKDYAFSSAYNNLAIVFQQMKLYDSSVFYSRKVVQIGLNQKDVRVLNLGLMNLAEVHDAMKDTKNALYYYRRLHVTEDSANKEAITTAYQELQSKFESDRKDSELKRNEDTIKLAASENSRKNVLILFSSIAFFMAIIAVIFIARSYRMSRKNAKALGQKNKLIQEKNKEITDSINYAKNIQQSLLTHEKKFKDNLKDHFILFNPKDIVSGDFYWAEKEGDEFLIMCADCTGHGVPGAFMSLLGISYLSEIKFSKKIFRPDLVLNELRARLIEGFSLTNNKDGMDASLIKINGLQLEMAAANNPVWVIRNKQNLVLKPDKFPIGKHHGAVHDFSLSSMKLEENDLIIAFTDGYADQFGGPKNKKFKYKNMEALIIENSHLPLENIKQILDNNMKDWMGQNEQVDDILVIGIRM